MNVSYQKRIDRVVAEVTKNGTKFPRSIFSDQLVKMGLVNTDEWIDYAKGVIMSPKNVEGRTLVLLLEDKESHISPCFIIARGRGGSLSESYVQPHIENDKCEYEKLTLKIGKATLIKFKSDGELSEAIPIGKNKIEVKPGEMHSILFDSPFVVLCEEKKVIPNVNKTYSSIFPREGDEGTVDLLQSWHQFADSI